MKKRVIKQLLIRVTNRIEKNRQYAESLAKVFGQSIYDSELMENMDAMEQDLLDMACIALGDETYSLYEFIFEGMNPGDGSENVSIDDMVRFYAKK